MTVRAGLSWGEWWAALACPQAYDALTAVLREELFEEFLRLARGWCEAGLQRRVRLSLERKWRSQQDAKQRLQLADRLLRPAYDLAQTVIIGLLKGEEVPTSAFSQKGIIPTLRLSKTGEIVPLMHVGNDWSLPAGQLYELIVSSTEFCFRRCPWCGKVFYRTGRRIYDSDSCKFAAHAARSPKRAVQIAAASQRYRARRKVRPQ